jgi:hypothetical protein
LAAEILTKRRSVVVPDDNDDGDSAAAVQANPKFDLLLFFVC